MNLSELSIKRPVLAWMAMLGLIFFGWLSYKDIGVSQMPDVDFPVLSISVSWEGAAPEVMELDVVDTIEDAVMGVEGLKELSSTSRQGSASITLEFDLNRNIDVALQETQSKLAEVQRRLPPEIDPPVVRKSNPEDQPILWIGVSAENKSVRELMEFVDTQIEDQFKTIVGVGEVFLGGFIEPNLRIWIDRDKLNQYQLTVSDIIRAVQEEHVEKPAGEIETSTREIDVRVMGEAATAEDFENMMIYFRGGQPIYRPIPLKEVAQIEDGLEDIRRITRVNGEQAVGIGIRKQRGANAVAVAQEVKRKIEDIRRTLPPGYSIGINFDSTQFIEDAVGELVMTLVLAAVLTSLVCWLFLGSLSSTVNIMIAIPTSILGTFIMMRFANFTMNTFTLLALILAVGIVVDDAIMVLENIVRHREQGETKQLAALNGARQITSAAIATSLAVIAIFLPVAFMKGIIGRFFFHFGVTISVAVALSTGEALSFAPMRCAQMLEVGPRKTSFGRRFELGFKLLTRAYRRALTYALQHRKWVLTGSFTLFAASLFLIPIIPKEFVPAQDQSMFLARIKTPLGSSFEYTNEKFLQLEKIIQSRPEVRRYLTAVGGFGGGGRSNEGMAFISLKDRPDRPKDKATGKKMSQKDMMDYFRKEFKQIPEVSAVMQDLSTRGFEARRGFPIEMTIRGPDWKKLVEYSDEIVKRMEQNAYFQDVDTDYLSGMPEARVYPDRDKAFEYGVSVKSIAETINALIAGQEVSKFSSGGRRYDVRVRIIPEQRTAVTDIEDLVVRNNRGELVPLSEVIRIEEDSSLLAITRRDRERAIGIFANVGEGKAQAAAISEARDIADEVLSKGYRAVFSGSSRTFQESFDSLMLALWLGIIISYMVLASQFNHVVHPFTILLALPFSVTGALLALYLGGFTLNMFSMIGLLLLLGIAKKNSILLVEFTNQMRASGLAPMEALQKACPLRFRAIMMTTISTIVAALPPALALGPGAETRIPMATSVIWGLIVSTTLTLFVVPCAYYVLIPYEKKENWKNVWNKIVRRGS